MNQTIPLQTPPTDRPASDSVGTVYLVGAGAGDDGLLTVRALELVRRCDVLVYDALSNPAFLRETKPDCKKLFVGKTPHAHSATQAEINALLVEHALGGAMVVRLKGGDPFVFGRGGEEAQALSERHIPYQLVAGVTSAVAALESAGIPVTHREVARSFTVVTGHVASDSAAGRDGAERFAPYAAIGGTLVFLMGVAALPDIAAGLMAGGASPDTPVAIVEQGTTVRERRTDGTLSTIVAVAARRHVRNPAVICVGDVAAFRFTSAELPLQAVRVAVTGTAPLVAKLCSPLKDRGALVYAAPFMQSTPNPALESLLPPLSAASWLVFTSANGVHHFFDHLRRTRTDLRSLSHLRFCVVGRGTADALLEHGFTADYAPDRYTVADMAHGFVSRWRTATDAERGATTATQCAKGVAAREQPIDATVAGQRDAAAVCEQSSGVVTDAMGEKKNDATFEERCNGSAVGVSADKTHEAPINAVAGDSVRGERCATAATQCAKGAAVREKAIVAMVAGQREVATVCAQRSTASASAASATAPNTAVAAPAPAGMVYVLRAADGSPDLNAAFDAAHIPYRDIPLYALAADEVQCDALLSQLDVLDYVTFASSSGARAFFERYAVRAANNGNGRETPRAAAGAVREKQPNAASAVERGGVRAQCAFVCIGAQTAKTVRQWCTQLSLYNRVLTARDYTAHGIVQAIVDDRAR